MKKLIAGAALGALVLGVVPIPAQAAPPEPTVEGQGVFETVGIPNTNSTTLTWSCGAVATPGTSPTAIPTGVIIDCTIKAGGGFVDRASRAAFGGATAIEPRVVVVPYGVVELCWEVLASYSDGVLRRDETGPNCEVGESWLEEEA